MLDLTLLVNVGAKAKPKASTVIRAMDAIERASRWRPLAVFFDEFQEIIENLEDKDSRHLLGVLRAEIQRHAHVSYLFAGSARSSMFDLGQDDLKRAFSALLAEVSRRGELILDSATPAQRRILFAIAIRENQETSTDSFIRFAGFKNNSSVGAALRPFF